MDLDKYPPIIGGKRKNANINELIINDKAASDDVNLLLKRLMNIL